MLPAKDLHGSSALLKDDRRKGGFSACESHARQLAQTPESVGEQETGDAGQRKHPLFRFQQVRENSGYEDKEERQGDKLKAEALIVRRGNGEQEAKRRYEQGGGVAKIACSRPHRVGKERGG